MISIENLTKLAHLFNAKGIVMKELMHPKRNNGVFNLDKFSKKVTTSEFFIENSKVITVYNKNSTKNHIIFLHGGSYVSEGVVFHRKIIEKMVNMYHFKVTYIDYPLAPEYNAIYTHDVVLRAYKKVIKKYDSDIFTLFGDSAGGGLALAFLQTLVKNNYHIPNKTVLISPWLDISMSNPKTFIYESKDPTLSVAGLLYAGKRYAGLLDIKDPLVSPIYGNLSNLNNLLVFVGTHETFYPDCVDLKNKCKNEKGTNIKLIVAENMFHDFVMTPIKESKEALDTISDFINDTKSEENN